MIQYKKILMTLALLLTAVTGAWATADPNSVTWNYQTQTWKGWTESETTHTVGDITITCSGNAKVYQSTSSGEPLALLAGSNDAITFTSNDAPFASISIRTPSETQVTGWTYDSSTRILNWSGTPSTSVTLSDCDIKADVITFTFGTAEPPITVEWNASTKTGSFKMPGSDVVLTPLYAPAAKWDVVESAEQLPAALEGIIAGQDEAIVTAGQSAQGTVMYAVTTTADAAPALTAFSATVPTAKDVADDGATLYVWYYIQGHDTPDGEQATEENTFNDSEISTEPLTVQVLTNKFDIQFTAANDNTIQAGKATVTVDDQPATVTDGKLQGVKMGSEVKMTAKPGYKFRKVEVKKYEAPSLNITNPVVGQVIGSDGKNYAANATLPDGVTKVAMIAYVSGSNGLAIALADEGRMNWKTAVSTAADHTPVFSNGTWKLPTQDEWKQMFNANGGSDSSWAGLNDALAAAGDDNSKLQVDKDYWSSSGIDNDRAYSMFIGKNSLSWGQGNKTGDKGVRPVLAF